jgi:hypothetical protein
MPPADGLPPPTAEQVPTSGPKRLLTMLMAIGVVDVAMLLGRADSTLLIPAMTSTAFVLYLFLSVRRTYTTVGPGWLFVRTAAFGSGTWMRFADIHTVKVGKENLGIPSPQHQEQQTACVQFRLTPPRPQDPLRQTFAEQALASKATISPEAAKYLHDWLT